MTQLTDWVYRNRYWLLPLTVIILVAVLVGDCGSPDSPPAPRRVAQPSVTSGAAESGFGDSGSAALPAAMATEGLATARTSPTNDPVQSSQPYDRFAQMTTADTGRGPVLKAPNGAQTRFGYAVPPDVELRAPPYEAAAVALERIGAGAPFPVDRRFVSAFPMPASPDRRMKLRTAAAIAESGTDAPHGRYRALFTVQTDGMSPALTREATFNYVYRTAFEELDSALAPHADAFGSAAQGGLAIRNRSAKGGFVSASLKQPFDLGPSFCVRGVFTMRPDNPRAPAGLDICLCDELAARLSIVIPDGHPDAYSIKEPGDRYGRGAVTVRGSGRRLPLYAVRQDGRSENHFLISVDSAAERGSVVCRLFVSHKPIDPELAKPVHVRAFAPDVLGHGFRRLRVRVWQAGEIALRELEVAALGSEARD